MNDDCNLELRIANEADSKDIWRWRNDLLTRTNSMDRQEVSRETHTAWFQSVLTNTRRTLYIGTTPSSKNPIGMVRFDANDEMTTSEVSINLNPTWRGKGLSAPLLALALEHYAQQFGGTLIADIRSDNSPSLSCFQACGFSVDRHRNDILVLIKRI